MTKYFFSFLFSTVTILFSNSTFSQTNKFIDPSNMDLSIKPGDNFYLYANGNWIKNNPVPASKTRWGSFNIIAENNMQDLKVLLENAEKYTGKNVNEKKVGDLYASAMDSLMIEKLGYTPIKTYLDEINNLSSKGQLLDYLNNLRLIGLSSPLYSIYVNQDAKNVLKYMLHIGQGGTTLPDKDYYLKNDARSTNVRLEYLKYIQQLYVLCGESEASSKLNAQTILQIETALANAQLSRVEMRDPQKLYNKFAVNSFATKTPHFNWQNTLNQLNYKSNTDSFIVNSPNFFYTVDSLIEAQSLAHWKIYLQWQVLKNSAPYLSSNFVDANFKFSKTLNGQAVQTPRWQRMSNLVDSKIGELLGQLYVEKYFNPKAKERMLALLKNMEETFGDRIKKLDWMTNETKVQALGKLHAIVRKIGYPDKWLNYDGLEIKRNDFFGNIQRANQWAQVYNANKLGKPINKFEWSMTPPTVNAYYAAQNNEIVFPAGILHFPFFDFNADDAINYGGIAAVIGHEMTHGFDDKGRQYDKNGNLADWWTKNDADEFKKRADLVVEQYNGFKILDTLAVNGKLTLGENLADLGGLNIAYEAYKKTPQGKSNKKIDGFTGDQRFFLNWAQLWRSNTLPAEAAQRILTDSHSPGEFRANGPLSNIDAFYEIFNVKEGDKMYKPKNQRIKIW